MFASAALGGTGVDPDTPTPAPTLQGPKIFLVCHSPVSKACVRICRATSWRAEDAGPCMSSLNPVSWNRTISTLSWAVYANLLFHIRGFQIQSSNTDSFSGVFEMCTILMSYLKFINILTARVITEKILSLSPFTMFYTSMHGPLKCCLHLFLNILQC